MLGSSFCGFCFEGRDAKHHVFVTLAWHSEGCSSVVLDLDAWFTAPTAPNLTSKIYYVLCVRVCLCLCFVCFVCVSVFCVFCVCVCVCVWRVGGVAARRGYTTYDVMIFPQDKPGGSVTEHNISIKRL